MADDFRRVAGIIVRAPLTRRTVRELLYCVFGGLAGAAGFYITIVMLASGLTITVSVLGTVIGLLLLTERTGVLRLEVTDDGVGGADAARGSGLAGLAQRVSTVDGHLEVSSLPGGSTTVSIVLPLKA